jgi:hypothetical protein
MHQGGIMGDVITSREHRGSECGAIERVWLLDEALEAAFPASDPVAEVQPGSTVAAGAADPQWESQP